MLRVLVLQVVWGLQLGRPPPGNHSLSIHTHSGYPSVFLCGNSTQMRALTSTCVLLSGGRTTGQQKLWLFPRGPRRPSSWWRVRLGPRVLAGHDHRLKADWTKKTVGTGSFRKRTWSHIRDTVTALYFLWCVHQKSNGKTKTWNARVLGPLKRNKIKKKSKIFKAKSHNITRKCRNI